MQKPAFVKDHIYHVYNRGVEKRTIFLDTQDYYRGIHSLFEFNDSNPTTNMQRRNPQMCEVEPRTVLKPPRKLLVEILAFCCMPNHFHLLVRQKQEGGIIRFMQKLGTGYTMYFNKKYDRVGPLLQGSFKAVSVEKDAHFFYLPFYIHANPLELFEPTWKQEGIRSIPRAVQFLENYRWSSHPDYLGKKNFPSVTQREPLLKLLGSWDEKRYTKELRKWLGTFPHERNAAMRTVLLEED